MATPSPSERSQRPNATDPEPLDALRELAQETMEQDDPEDGVGNLAASGFAMLAAAAVLTPIAWWLIQGARAVAADAATLHRDRSPSEDMSWLLWTGACGVVFLIGVLVIFSLVTLAKIVMRKLGP